MIGGYHDGDDDAGKEAPKATDEDHPMAVAFLAPGLVAVGGSLAIRQAIDRQGGQSVLDNHEMMDLVRDLDTSSAWAVGRSTR